MNVEEDKFDKIELLESAPHFSFLSFDDKNLLVQYMMVEEFLPGDILMREGENQNKVHFIFEGVIEIVKTSAEGDPVPLARLGRGEIVGEVALQPNPSQSTVVIRAIEKTQSLCLPREAFEDMMENSPGTAFRILFDVIRLLRHRLNDVSSKLADLLSEGK